MGAYIESILKFSKTDLKLHSEIQREIKQILSVHWSFINSSVWKSLPELTNKNGAHCPASCSAQAWSLATILNVLEKLEYPQ